MNLGFRSESPDIVGPSLGVVRDVVGAAIGGEIHEQPGRAGLPRSTAGDFFRSHVRASLLGSQLHSGAFRFSRISVRFTE